MTLTTRVKADKKPYQVPRYINCSKCNKKALMDSDVELSQNLISKKAGVTEENYKCIYTCPNGHKTSALVEVEQ